MIADRSIAYTFITDVAPVQAIGTVGGRPFYFRARHDEWTFGVSAIDGRDPETVDAAVASAGEGWFRRGHIGARWESAASHLSVASATAIIHECAAAYLDEAAT